MKESCFFFRERWTFGRGKISVTYQITIRCLLFRSWYWALWKRFRRNRETQWV